MNYNYVLAGRTGTADKGGAQEQLYGASEGAVADALLSLADRNATSDTLACSLALGERNLKPVAVNAKNPGSSLEGPYSSNNLGQFFSLLAAWY
jgi:hypothetical protein